MKRKYRTGQRVTVTRYVEGREGIVCSGTVGIVRADFKARDQLPRYLVAFPRTDKATDGCREYWVDEDSLDVQPLYAV